MRSLNQFNALTVVLVIVGCPGCGQPTSTTTQSRTSDGHRTRMLRDNLSNAGISILEGATRVEVYRVASEEVKNPARNTIGGYPILFTGKEKDQAFATRLTTVLLGDGVTRNSKKCGLEPGVAYRLWKGDQAVEVLVCFKCDVLWPHVVGEHSENPHHEWQDFDSVAQTCSHLRRNRFQTTRRFKVSPILADKRCQ